MKSKVVKFLAIVLTLVLGLTGCSKKDSSNDNSENISELNIQKSDYIHLTMLFPKTMNPVLNTDKSVNYIMNLIYDGLFEIDENYNVEPRLVENYTISSDGKSINIQLMSNANWHNNKSVTSSDVDYTVDLIKKNKDSAYYSLVENIESIKINDSKNFTINLKKNDPFTIDKLIFPIVSKDQLSGLKSDELNDYKNNLIGNGPYKIKKYKYRKYMILERNEEYFGNLPENRKQIYVKMVPDNDSKIEMVLALDSDITSINISELSKFQDKKEFNITNYEGRDYEMVMFNYDSDYLSNANFRKAIISSIDTKKILKEAYLNKATISHFPLNTKSKYYAENLSSISYNRDKSIDYLVKSLESINTSLKQKEQNENNQDSSEQINGIVDDNALDNSNEAKLNRNEIKTMLSKINLKIIVSNDDEKREKVAQTIKQSLASIGIKSEISELNADDFSKAVDSKKYDLAIVGYSLSSIPDATDILKACNIQDKQLTKYIDELANSTSEAETKKIYQQIQKRVVNQGAFISLGILDKFVVSNKRLEGDIHPNDFDIYKGISNLQMNK